MVWSALSFDCNKMDIHFDITCPLNRKFINSIDELHPCEMETFDISAAVNLFAPCIRESKNQLHVLT